MRAVSFVKRIVWEVPGTICRHGLTIGDVDNDGDNEFVVGTAEGDLCIFKGLELWQKITGLGLITSVAVGDIFNYGRNALVVICGDGWAHIFYSPRSVNPSNSIGTATQQGKRDSGSQGHNTTEANVAVNSGNTISSDQADGDLNELSGKMECVHVQRIPTNTKVVLIADIDKDGANEMIIGLTDRVVRSYRWSSNADLGTGKLVGLNKWECANQIGTVTLQHTADGTPALLVGQPGGTFMRIKCNPDDCHSDEQPYSISNEAAASCVDYQTLGISRMRNQNISTEIIGDLEPGAFSFIPEQDAKTPTKTNLDKAGFAEVDQMTIKNLKSMSIELKGNYLETETKESQLRMNDEYGRQNFMLENEGMMRFYSATDSLETDQVDGNFIGGNVILGEYDAEKQKDSALPTFKDFKCSDNNNDDTNNNNDTVTVQKEESNDTEDSATKRHYSKGKSYALATLDGTIMLVKDETILWAMQVDHQIFSLCQLDVTGDGSDEIIACAWDGQTYILDQQRNSVRFQFEEPVNAFCTGKYSVNPGSLTPCFVYNTFNNKIMLYYDINLPSMVIKPLNPLECLDPDEQKKFNDLLNASDETDKRRKMQQLTEWLLYGVH